MTHFKIATTSLVVDRDGCVELPRAIRTKGRSYLPGSNLSSGFSTTLTSSGTNVYSVQSMTWQGTLLAGYNVSSNWEGGGTAYAAAYDADAHLSAWNATNLGTVGSATQQFNEGYTFSLENLKSVNATNSIGAQISSTYNYADPTSAERVTSISAPGSPVTDTYVYDRRGRGLVVQHKLNAAQAVPQDSYEYDSQNRLISIAHLGTTQETLDYDGVGDLASRQFAPGHLAVNGTDLAPYYVGDDLTLVDHDAATKTGLVHIRLGGKRLASFWAKSAGGTNTNGVIYYHRDRRGDVVATTAGGGQMGLSYRYLPSGAIDKIIAANGQAVSQGAEADNVASELGFIGGLKLSGGLIHLKARAYSPALRRFLQSDTIDLRRYTYGHGDPLNFIDPSGRNSCESKDSGSCKTQSDQPPPPPPPPPPDPHQQWVLNQGGTITYVNPEGDDVLRAVFAGQLDASQVQGTLWRSTSTSTSAASTPQTAYITSGLTAQVPQDFSVQGAFFYGWGASVAGGRDHGQDAGAIRVGAGVGGGLSGSKDSPFTSKAIPYNGQKARGVIGISAGIDVNLGPLTITFSLDGGLGVTKDQNDTTHLEGLVGQGDVGASATGSAGLKADAYFTILITAAWDH